MFEKGYFSSEDVSKALPEELAQEFNLSEQAARDLIEAAANRPEPGEADDTAQPISEERADDAPDAEPDQKNEDI